MEKVHGTSANVRYKIENGITLFSGGSKHEIFTKLFDKEALKQYFVEREFTDITIFGEAYGGKCQGMRESYGDQLQFVAFEVRIDNMWLSVPRAEMICNELGIEFMPYEKIPCTLEAIDSERDRESIIGFRRTGKHNIPREGVVLRPLVEFTHQTGGVIRVKHKREEFHETKTSRKVIDPELLLVLEKASEIAEEWVTPMRLKHVLDKLPEITDMSGFGIIAKAMIEDIEREAKGEIVESKEARKAITRKTAKLASKYFKDQLYEGFI